MKIVLIVAMYLPKLVSSGIPTEFKMKILSCGVLFAAIIVHAQLSITVLQPKIIVQKAVVPLTITNNLGESVESARAVCFLLDERGKMAGQSTKWVIGGGKDRPALQPKTGTTFNFVITTPQPFTTTNLTAQVSFSRVVMDGGRLANVAEDVRVTTRAR